MPGWGYPSGQAIKTPSTVILRRISRITVCSQKPAAQYSSIHENIIARHLFWGQIPQFSKTTHAQTPLKTFLDVALGARVRARTAPHALKKGSE